MVGRTEPVRVPAQAHRRDLLRRPARPGDARPATSAASTRAPPSARRVRRAPRGCRGTSAYAARAEADHGAVGLVHAEPEAGRGRRRLVPLRRRRRGRAEAAAAAAAAARRAGATPRSSRCAPPLPPARRRSGGWAAGRSTRGWPSPRSTSPAGGCPPRRRSPTAWRGRAATPPAPRAADPLDFTWSQESPTREQWDAGQRYGICWVPGLSPDVLQDDGEALADADADRGHAPALPRLAQPLGQGADDAGARGAERVADGDGAALGIDELAVGEPLVEPGVDAGQRLDGEGLVELDRATSDQVMPARRSAIPAASTGAKPKSCGSRANAPPAGDAGLRLQAEALAAPARAEQEGGGPVVER